MYVCIYACMHVWICMYAYCDTYVCACVSMYVFRLSNARTHARTHARTDGRMDRCEQTHTHRPSSAPPKAGRARGTTGLGAHGGRQQGRARQTETTVAGSKHRCLCQGRRHHRRKFGGLRPGARQAQAQYCGGFAAAADSASFAEGWGGGGGSGCTGRRWLLVRTDGVLECWLQRICVHDHSRTL